MQRRYEVTSHENFSHTHIDSVGYDWEVAANPDIEPKRPLRIYLPATTEEIAMVIKEAKRLNLMPIRIRSKGHSSNDLVLAKGGTVLWTEYLTGIGEIKDGSVWVQAGATMVDVDAYLDEQGYGLPVIGDHNHITAGGFASVGGVSPASNVHGLFVDHVEEIEWVDWHAFVRRCSRTEDPVDFYKLLAGTGQHGVIARLRCKVIPVRKNETILWNKRKISWNLEAFVKLSSERIKDPQGAQMERGLWLDFPMGRWSLKVGQYSGYHETKQTRLKSLRNRAVHAYLHGLGYVAGRLPGFLDRLVQLLGVAGIIFAPRYASIKNVEAFADKVLDSSVGDPHRMFIVFARVDRYEELFHHLHDLCREFRNRGCLSFISIYVKGISSPYLSLAIRKKEARFCELLLYLGVKPDEMTDSLLEELVSRIDQFCEKYDALRYMHTRTVGPKHRLRPRIDPNARVAEALRE